MTKKMLDELFEPSIIILGIFGNTKISEQDIQHNLTLILQEIGRLPDKILIPTDGNSSIYIQDWAESLHIKTQLFHSDWIKNGKIAQIIRDDRIAKECTHALVFIKTNRLEKLSEKMCKNDKCVFTFDNHLTQLVCELSQKVSKPSHKSNKGTTQTLLKYQKTAECGKC